MSDDRTPSPADRPVQAEHAERHGLSKLPWESALFASVSELEAQLHACRKENAELQLANSQLRATLTKARAWARHSNENWGLRQQAWHRERAELLARLGDDGRRR
jgi:regulator of replication initiation timing